MDEWLRFQTYINEIPSVSVGVFLEDEVIFQKSYGYVNLKTRRKATPDTMYRIASHSKLFTATTIMRLRAAGELRLDDLVSNYLRWFESKKDENVAHITLRQLLTHSSGLVLDGRTLHWGDDRFPDEEQVIEQVQAGATVQHGYEHWKYSNFGFTILGQVIAAITGKSYEEAVMELVFKPLGMTRSYPDMLPKQEKHHATGYGKRFPEKGRSEMPQVRARAMNSATGFSSAVDGPAQNLRTGMQGLLKKAIEDFDKFTPEKKVPAEMIRTICGFYQSDWGIWQYGDVNGKLVGPAPDTDDPAAELFPYEHTGKLRFKTPLLTDQNTTYRENFRFEMTATGRVSRLVEPGMVSKPYRFQ